MNRLLSPLPLLLALGLPALAQEAPPSFEELQAMIARMQRQVDQLGASTAERDKALQFLDQQVEKAAGQIDGADQTNDSLRGQAASLGNELQGVSAQRDQLSGEMGAKGAELDQTKGQLEALLATLEGERQGRATAGQDLDAAKSRLAALESEAGAKAGELQASRSEIERARGQLAALQGTLEGERQGRATAGQELEAARSRLAALEGEVGARAGELQSSRAELDQARQRLALIETELTAAKAAASREAQGGLATEIATLKGQNEDLRSMLDAASEAEDKKDREIAALNERLEGTDEGQDLTAARSEFFGRLRQALGERQDLRIVGDRFVFQAELLFGSGSSTLDPAGLGRLHELAVSLREVADTIPPDIDWVLRVDGHTDRLPVRYGQFKSNWDLSAARAISVVEFLVREGIPPNRLAATGFGEFRPLDARDDEIAYRRNRRIEFKLTEG